MRDMVDILASGGPGCAYAIGKPLESKYCGGNICWCWWGIRGLNMVEQFVKNNLAGVEECLMSLTVEPELNNNLMFHSK